MNKNKIITNSFEETQKFAEEFAKTLKGGEILCLYGDLGYGKTTFIQGLARGLGVSGRIISPTFIIMRTYRIKNQELRIKNIFHIDLYRMNNEQEISDLGLFDILGNPENIVAIEWPEKMGGLLPMRRIDVRLEYVEDQRRNIKISNY